MTPNPITDAELNAYVDGELDTAACRDVEAWLADHPDDAARVEAYRRQRVALHDLFDGVLEEDLPDPLVHVVHSPVRRCERPVWMRIAAALMLVTFGAGGGWLVRDIQDVGPGKVGPMFVDRAVDAHLIYATEVRHPVEVGADQEAHLVAWLSKRLGHPLKAPDLKSVGYTLVGGRLLPDGSEPAAQFMYEDTGGRRVTVYLRPEAAGSTAFRFTEERGAAAFYWIDAPFAYALTAKLSREELLRIAKVVYEALESDRSRSSDGAM